MYIPWIVLAAGLSACTRVSVHYAERLRPLNVVTYVTTDNLVIKKKAHFGDKYSNVVTLTDDAKDGLLPYGDEDGLVDQVTIEIYNRGDLGELINFVITGGRIYTNHLSAQREKSVRHINKKAVGLLTEKFLGQTNYVKTASTKTEYEITLQNLDVDRSEAAIVVDGQEAQIKENVMQKVNGVYIMLDKIKHLGYKKFGDDIDPGFAVVLIGNQSVLLKEGQKSKISVDQAEARNHKLLKKEKINFVFVVGDTVPNRHACEMEDIFHSFLIDHAEHEHVSFYRMIREMDGPVLSDSHEVGGYRLIEDPYAEPKPGNIATDMKDEIKDRMKDLYNFLYEVKDQALSFGGTAGRAFWSPGKK